MSSDEGEDRLYELYVEACTQTGVTPSVRDFAVWLDEKGYNDDLTDL